MDHTGQMFNVIMDGVSAKGKEDVSPAVERIAAIFKIDQEKARRMLFSGKVVVKKCISYEKGDLIRAKIVEAGGHCYLEQTLSEPDANKGSFNQDVPEFNCPKCKYRCQIDGSICNGDICPACGVVVEKFLKAQQMKQDQEETSTESEASDNHTVSDLSTVSDVMPNRFFKWIKWGFAALGMIICLITGIEVADIPTYEVFYRLNPADLICSNDNRIKHHPELQQYMADTNRFDLCIKSFRLDLYNSGSKLQPQTVVRLKLPDKTAMVLLPMFRDYDKAQRPVKSRIKDGITSYALGQLEPFDHVSLRFKIVMAKNEEIKWEDVLQKIDIAKGEVQQGESPKSMMITRLLISMINIFDTTPKDAVEKLSDMFLDSPTEKDMEINKEFDEASADLEISAAIKVQKVGPFPVVQLRLNLFNHGPGDASNIRLRYNLPDSIRIRQQYLDVEGVQPTMGEVLNEMRQPRVKGNETPKGCEVSGKDVTCIIQKLIPQGTAFVNIDFQPEKTIADHIWLTVESDTADPNTKNNEFLLLVAVDQNTDYR